MHRLIGDLLQLSRIQTRAGGMSATDSNEVVRQALESMKLDISDAKAEIICQKLPMVWGDSGQLLQLFQNLVGNAIKFQKEGTRPHVEISALPEEEHWHFQIRDNGIGIPADQMPRLFVIFSRLHTTEAYPGTGIGLAICKKIVERHLGKIWVESVPDVGTTFHFTLPAVPQ
jgi:signal transduction histidine kinase